MANHSAADPASTATSGTVDDAPGPSLAALSVRNARVMACVVGSAALVFWPLDYLLFDPRVTAAFPIWRVPIAVLGLGSYFLLGRRRPAAAGARDVIAIVVVLCAGAAACGVGLATAGDLREPWFHASYLLPLTTVPLLLSLVARGAAALCVVSAFVAAYFATAPAQLASPAVPGVLSFLGFALIASVAVGDMVFRVSVENLAQRRRLATDAAHLRELSRVKSELFANASHELRTPLTLILTSLRAVQDVPGVDHALVEAGLRNTARLLLLIDDLLQMSRLQVGRGSPRMDRFDLVALVHDVAASFAGRDALVVETREAALWIRGDSAQLVTVLYNLLSNAFKFTDPGSRRVRVRVVGAVGEVTVEVEDNGIGIRPDHLERVFERFEQAERDARRRFGGVGIGLSLVRDIARAHGGRIEVASEPGVGSRFTLVLPRHSEDAGEVPRAPAPVAEQTALIALARAAAGPHEPRPEPAGTAPLILVAEDDADLRGALVRILGRSYRVLASDRGQAALALARAHHPDLVVADLMMPVMSGLDLVRAIRDDPSLARVPVLILTAIAGSAPRIAAFEAGAEDFLTKPFEPSELLARVNNLLLIRRHEHALAAMNQRLEQRVAERTEELRRLAAHLERCREDERRRLARELHDETGQLLMALRLDLALVRPSLATAEAAALDAAARMDDVLQQLLGLVRSIISELRPRILDELGLSDAVRWYVEQFAERTGLACDLRVVAPSEPTGERATVLFRVLQEALTNVARHARARRVTVTLDALGDHAALAIEDDGAGFDPERRTGGGMGLVGMTERVRALGGELVMASEPSRGTTCRAMLPAADAGRLAL